MENVLRTELTTIWGLFTSTRKNSLGEVNRNNFFASCFKNLLIKKSVCLEDFVLMWQIRDMKRMGVFISWSQECSFMLADSVERKAARLLGDSEREGPQAHWLSALPSCNPPKSSTCGAV